MNLVPEGRAARLRGLRSDRAGESRRAEVAAILTKKSGSTEDWTLTLPSESVELRARIGEIYTAARDLPGYSRTEFLDLGDCLKSARAFLELYPDESRWIIRFEESSVLGLWSTTNALCQAKLSQLMEFDREAMMLLAKDFGQGFLIDCSESFDSWVYTLETWEFGSSARLANRASTDQ